MSSENSTMYFPPIPPAPPLEPLLVNKPLITNYTSPKDPQEELLEARDKLRLREGLKEAPRILSYKYVAPILQDGPKCGLVALCMASYFTPHPISVDHLYEVARLQGYTNLGEMFSVDFMAALVRHTFQPCPQVEILHQGLQDKENVLRHIQNGSLLLVPPVRAKITLDLDCINSYDADGNHSPCCRWGHKAHWAIVSGALQSQDSCYLLARQGKSRHLGVWLYEEVRLSNQNLEELDPGRVMDGHTYVLPPGGVAAGLQGQAILLHGMSLD
uniref:Actin maturation protease n=1 Tax=Timema genevievae TaxID=629358 RepID=A0A7R9K3W9_TIMGE|nr:unnamed protein product [Timema genevievae]